MKSIFNITLIFVAVVACTPKSEATLITAGWFFDQNDDSAVTSLTQTITAANGNITFDINVSITSTSGTVVDTSNVTGPANQMFGLGVGAGNNIAVGQQVDFSVSVSNVVQNGPYRINLQDLSFRFLGVEAGNGVGSSGRLITPAGSSGTNWTDANGPHPPGTGFNGLLPFTTMFNNTNNGFYVTGGVQQAGNFNVQSGFDIPRSNVTNGGTFGTPVTSFSHLTTAGSYRLNDLVVQVRATPEPTSFALGFVALLSGGGVFWRRRKSAALDSIG
jgi:hypothetical protein